MVKYHPYQHLYFNFIAGKDYSKVFDTDYWGLSYKEGIEYILKNDQRDKIKIETLYPKSREKISYILDEKERSRLFFNEDIQTADYLLTTFKTNKEFSYNEEFYSIIINDNKIMTIFKLNSN